LIFHFTYKSQNPKPILKIKTEKYMIRGLKGPLSLFSIYIKNLIQGYIED